MNKLPVILIFDVGKTNKKILLFDQQYKLVYEESKQFSEIKDEDDFPCEDVQVLTQWVRESFLRLSDDGRFDIKAVNFSAYGASFVYLDDQLQVIPPLYNYLKPYPAGLQNQFYVDYGGKSEFARKTASPVLGNLNSGMQLYRLKFEKPDAFDKIRYALHLPQYLSFILSAALYSEITSIGCHTNLWNFEENRYHHWVNDEKIGNIFPPLFPCEKIAGYANVAVPVGTGLHDSSAALIPYFSSFHEPFVLLSTGTWCISLNPFNKKPLSDYELNHDCLCYLSYRGDPVKASRLFAGYEHEQQIKNLAMHFKKPNDYFTTVQCDLQILNKLKRNTNSHKPGDNSKAALQQSVFSTRNLHDFADYNEAYHQLIADIMVQQVESTELVTGGTTVKRIFVDGGFSRNPIYMYLLAESFSAMEVYAASVPQASAFGAALAIHSQWNNLPLPADIIELKLYSVVHDRV